MSLLNLFNKINQASKSTSTKTSTGISKFEQVFSIHDDLKGLIWIADGKHKNYTPEKKHIDDLVFEDFRISFSFSFQEEPSLIYTNQTITITKNPKLIDKPSYFPSYSNLSPAQKGVYLQFLANPYWSDADIGYVFILYYGLERHLLCGKFERAFDVILKLRKFHRNSSFLYYSGNALLLTCMMHNRGDMALKFLASLDKKTEAGVDDNLTLIYHYSFKIPLNSEDLMAMAKTFEFTNLSYIKKYPDIFKENLRALMINKYGKDVLYLHESISKNQFNKLKYDEKRVFANTSLSDKNIPVPLFSEIFQLKKDINLLLENAHENVKQTLVELRKSGIKPEVVEPEKKEKSLIAFDENEEKRLLHDLEKSKAKPLDRHFCYISLYQFYYKYRELSEDYLDKCINYCYLDINSLDEMEKAYYRKELVRIKNHAKYLKEKDYEQKEIAKLKEEGFIGSIPAFERLVIIYEKKKEYVKAIEICHQALKYRPGIPYYIEKIQKLQKKMEKE